jgi:outer membrane lipase/esterase
MNAGRRGGGPRRAAALLACLVLAACGGGGEDEPPPRYASLVSFGDSMSDVGTHAVGSVATRGGGKYTVNSPSTRIWIELLAAQLGLPAPCPAQVGLDGSAAEGFQAMPPVDAPACNAYGQGGSRVIDPVGVGNKALGGDNARMGYLTEPVSAQIDRHLARHGDRFLPQDLVFLLVGGNDVFIQLGDTALPAGAVDGMRAAGQALAEQVATKIVGHGAQRVVVVNLPDVSATPFALRRELRIPGSRDFIREMVRAYNGALRAGLEGLPGVLLVDAYRASVDQAVHPAQYGLVDVTVPVCDPALPSPVELGLSLLCTTGTRVPGATERHLYADLIHPTPYGHRLLAQLVALEMAKKAWI